MADTPLTLVNETVAIDLCWKRIGVEGDRSCELLKAHVHCRNCERYTQAALQLLDRYQFEREDWSDDEPPVAEQHYSSVLVFRVGQDWLALASGSLAEVAANAPIHRLPHPRSQVLLGVSNVRGALVPCVSLNQLLGLASVPDPERPNRPRLLIIDSVDGPLVAPVDEVDAIHRIPTELLSESVQPSGLPVSQLAKAVVEWQGRSITWLDEGRLVQAMLRSLT